MKPRKCSDYTTVELSMHVVEFVRSCDMPPGILLAEIATRLEARFHFSRAPAFRYARTAIDVLGIPYDPTDPARLKRKQQRIESSRIGRWYDSREARRA